MPAPDRTAPMIDRLVARAREAAPNATASIVVDAPFTAEPLAEVPAGTAADVADAAERARELQPAWAARSFAERAEILMRFHDLVLERRDEVLDLLQLEGGKARIHAYEEVLDVAMNARYYANTAAGYLRTKRRAGVFPGLTRVYEHHHPRGVVGFIVPWNYPLALGISDAIPALVAGNGAVIKPDAQTPLSALWARELLELAGLPRGLCQMVTGEGSVLGEPIIDNTDYVMFTGSTRVGRIVAAQCGERLKECSMELGGKNAMLVLADADLDHTANGAMRAAWTNAGQLCISMERCYVAEHVAGDFIGRLVENTRRMKLGTALDWSYDMGSLISDKQFETVCDHVDDAREKGARVLAGGRPRPEVGPRFYEPTILAGVTPEMSAYRDETFGPVLSVYEFDRVEEAIERANDSDYGLNFSVWSKDTKAAHWIGARLEAGTVNVNEGYSAAWGSVDSPMGGFKQSGFGRRHGEHGIHKYTQSQTIAIQRGLPVSTPPTRDAALRSRILATAVKALSRIPFVK